MYSVLFPLATLLGVVSSQQAPAYNLQASAGLNQAQSLAAKENFYSGPQLSVAVNSNTIVIPVIGDIGRTGGLQSINQGKQRAFRPLGLLFSSPLAQATPAAQPTPGQAPRAPISAFLPAPWTQAPTSEAQPIPMMTLLAAIRRSRRLAS